MYAAINVVSMYQGGNTMRNNTNFNSNAAIIAKTIPTFNELDWLQQSQVLLGHDSGLKASQLEFLANPRFNAMMMTVIRKDFEEKVLSDEQIKFYARNATDYTQLIRSRLNLLNRIEQTEKSRKNLKTTKTTSRSAVIASRSIAMARKAGVSENRIMHSSDELRRWLGGGR
jgi:hypothetical protein